MRVVNMLVEGMTEHQFVGQVLKPYLMNFEVFVVPTIVKTKHTHQGTWERGGAPPYYMFKKRLTELLGNQTRTTTMMFDLYGLPDDFPNRDVSPGSAPRTAAVDIQDGIHDDLGRPANFIPFVVRHEFEAFVFVSDTELPFVIGASRSQRLHFERVCSQFACPEDIDDSPVSAPSKRLVEIFPNYNKVVHGVAAVQGIGMETIMERCPHLRAWVQRIVDGAL